MVKVRRVERVHEVEVNDGYYFVTFRFDPETNKLVTVSKGAMKSRMHQPVYIPKKIFTSFVKQAYAVFYNSKKRKADNDSQLVFNFIGGKS